MNKLFKYLYVFIFLVLVVAAGFTFTVREGSTAIVSRFGRIVNVHTEAGMHFRLPWPIDRIIVYDARNQYMDSGFIETMTNDMINIILQTYLVWNVQDAERFHISVGDYAAAQRHLNSIVANTKNGVLGNFTLSNLVSTDPDDIMLDEIRSAIEMQVAAAAISNFGIEVQTLRFRRLALPHTNILSVFEQMIADRQRHVSRYLTEGERDAAIIISEAEAQSAEIIAQGRLEASMIDAETERRVAEIYGEAFSRNPELFTFLMNLIALENSVNTETVIVMRASESPFNVITGAR
ncbi:MAG: protease modulator HflC [Treponema sp.]|jgi:membrane protease subunit HflC|nr:protease modulator HflC [Treponema sp.]